MGYYVDMGELGPVWVEDAPQGAPAAASPGSLSERLAAISLPQRNIDQILPFLQQNEGLYTPDVLSSVYGTQMGRFGNWSGNEDSNDILAKIAAATGDTSDDELFASLRSTPTGVGWNQEGQELWNQSQQDDDGFLGLGDFGDIAKIGGLAALAYFGAPYLMGSAELGGTALADSMMAEMVGGGLGGASAGVFGGLDFLANPELGLLNLTGDVSPFMSEAGGLSSLFGDAQNFVDNPELGLLNLTGDVSPYMTTTSAALPRVPTSLPGSGGGGDKRSTTSIGDIINDPLGALKKANIFDVGALGLGALSAYQSSKNAGKQAASNEQARADQQARQMVIDNPLGMTSAPSPLNRAVMPYAGVYSKYGMGPSHNYFGDNNRVDFQTFAKRARGGLGAMTGREIDPEEVGEIMPDSGKSERLVRGQGGGQDDKVAALLSPDEYVMDADVVAALGDGSPKEGAKKLDKLRERVRRHKRAAPAHKIPPKAKPIEKYMGGR